MIKTATPEKYKSIDFKPPKSVAKAAERGLELRREQEGDKAGLTNEEAGEQDIGSGVQRAVNLKNRDTVSPETINDMVGFFARFSDNISKARKLKTREEQIESNMYVSDLLWGGKPGEKWANKIKKKMEEADKKKESSLVDKVSGRFFEALDMEYYDQQDTVPWRFLEKDPYPFAMGKLRKSLAYWQEMMGSKKEIMEIYKKMHPDLKKALDKANKKVMSGPTIAWRHEHSGRFPSDLGGYSLHLELEPGRVKSSDLDEFQAYLVKPSDVLVHPDIPDNPLQSIRYAYERELILKPNANPKPLSRKKTEKMLQNISKKARTAKTAKQIVWRSPQGFDPYDFAKQIGIHPDSTKEFTAAIKDGNRIAAVLFTGHLGGTYSFDIAVHPDYQRKGYGSELMDFAIDEYEDLLFAIPDLEFHLDAINPVAVKMLKRRGFDIIRQQGHHTYMERKSALISRVTKRFLSTRS